MNIETVDMTAQTELSLGVNQRSLRERRRAKQRRAAWWFQRMRLVVNEATEWLPADAPRFRQTTLPLASPWQRRRNHR